MKGITRLAPLALAPALVFLGLFYFYPVASILGLSFSPEAEGQGTSGTGGALAALADPYFLDIILFTIWQAALSTLLTLAVGLPAAYALSRWRFKGSSLYTTLITVPFVLPTVVVAAAFAALLGPKGLLNQALMLLPGVDGPLFSQLHSLGYVLAAHLFFNVCVVARIVGNFWARLPASLAESARMLGASPFTAFRRVTWPLLFPAVAAASLLVFIFCFTSFGVVLILGGPGLATIEVAIYRQAIHLFDLPVAAALSMVQIAFTFALMAVYTWLERRWTAPLAGRPAPSRGLPPGLAGKLGAVACLAPAGMLAAAPLAALLIRSLSTSSGFSLAYYASLFSGQGESIFAANPLSAMGNSLGFALATLALALFLGLSACLALSRPKSTSAIGRLGSLLDPLFMLPLSTSAVTLGFGFIIALDAPPLDLRTSLALVPLAHTLVAFPFVVRSLLPALRSVPGSLRESAAMLGAGPLRSWLKVDLAISAPAIRAAAAFALAVSLGEFGATVFAARPDTQTMPLAIFRYLGQPGAMNFGRAMAMASLLALTTGLSVFFLERAGQSRLGEF